MKTGKLIAEGSNSCEDYEWTDLNYNTGRPSKSVYWVAVVHNFGWRKLNGRKEFKANTLTEMLSAILPNTECNFKIYNYGNRGIAVQNYHHDSCTGDEWYYIVPISERLYNNCRS